MRLITAFAGIALATSIPVGAVAQDDQAAELIEARAIMEIAFPPAEREQTFATVVTQMLDQMRSAIPMDSMSDPGLKALFNRYMDSIPQRFGPAIAQHLPRIFEATAIAYTNEFTLSELKDIRAFAESPSGKRYLQRSSALLGDPAVAAANSAFLADAQELQSTLQNELIQELSAYLAENPEATADLLGASQP